MATSFDRFKELLSKVRDSIPARPDGSTSAADKLARPGDARNRAVETAPEPPNVSVQSWIQMILAPVPLGMAIVGTLLAVFTEIIGPWAFLGYLLLSTAPIVYWLSRIEARLAELVQFQKSDRGR